MPGPVPTSPANRDYQAGFTAAMMLKDLKLAQDAAKAAGAATPLGADAAKIYARYVDERRGRPRLLRHHPLHPRRLNELYGNGTNRSTGFRRVSMA